MYSIQKIPLLIRHIPFAKIAVRVTRRMQNSVISVDKSYLPRPKIPSRSQTTIEEKMRLYLGRDSWMNLPRRLITIRFAPFAESLIATLYKRTKLPLRTKAMVGEVVAVVCSCLGRLDCCAACAAKALKWNQKVNCGGCAKNAEKLISPLPMR